MKQSEDIYIAFPKKQPKTISGMHRWHRDLLESCLYFEFKKRTLAAALAKLDDELQVYISARREGLERPANLALKELNRLKREYIEELQAVKGAIRIIHDTNEMIIGSLVAAHSGKDAIRHVMEQQPHPESNLLHGTGWLFEILTALELEKEGYVGFVTFGTLFDPAGFDVIAFSKPRRRVTLQSQWSKRQTRKSDRLRRD